MLSFFTELKRRNVFKVGVAYAIVGWLLIQVIVAIESPLHLPDWVDTLTIIFLITGLPVALIIAWAFELTPEGVKRSHEVAHAESITSLTGRKFDFAIIVLLLIAVVFMALDNYVWVEKASPPLVNTSTETKTEVMVETPVLTDSKSIAVLPFVNMSADPEQEYFGDGIAEEILNGLAQIEDLKVAARTSSFYFKGEKVNLKTIGETLNVAHVLEGSVRKSGDKLRITAQLIKVEDGFHLWSETYNRDTTDIFAVQEEIARTVVEKLQVKLGLTFDEKLIEQGTNNVEAYNWYLRGRYYVGVQSADSFEKAVESYRKVIELDPEFAGGYGGLAYASSYNTALFGDYKDVVVQTRKAYSKALAIDDKQSEALLARAYDRIMTDFDFAEADTLIRKALSRGRNKVLVVDFAWFAFLAPQKRYAEALRLLQALEQQDPLSSLVKQGIAHNLTYLDRNEEAVDKFKEVVELNPTDLVAHFILVDLYIKMKRFAEAEDVIRTMERMVGEDYYFVLSARTRWHSAQGNRTEAEASLQGLKNLYDIVDGEQPVATFIGLHSIRLGRVDEGMDWLERAVNKPDLVATFLYQWTQDIPEIRDNPRFQALLKKMNLDDESINKLKEKGPL